ncbi:MAG: hypothetical protein AAGK30_15570 [Pseudomonadota bacterium]
MIASLAAACLGSGLAIGFVLARRFWLRSWVGLMLICVALTLAVFVGALPPGLAPENVAAAVLILLVPPPFGAGLLVGGIIALFLRRHAKPT